jgi:signal transduction histidine kinase
MKRLITVNRLINVSSADPDDARRRQLLNILLIGVGIIAFLGIVAIGVASVIGALGGEDAVRLLSGLSIALLGFILLFLINRYVSGTLAGALFVAFLIAVIGFSDDPQMVVEGRTLFLFAIPILVASVVLPSWGSFIAAGLSSVLIAVIAISIRPGYVPPLPTMFGFFAIALVAWLSARSLENALQELRAINAELDQRVEDRTRELREANAQLAEANEHLRELDRLKSRFVSMVSHELRTPLTGIQGFAEMIQAEVYGPISDQQDKALKRILVNTTQLISIVNDLLDQARIEAGQLSIRYESFSPHALADDLHSTMLLLAKAHNLTLETEVAPDVPEYLVGDRHRLHQILVNLINNAIKFTKEGGIELIFYRPDEENWAFDVIDTGPGIPEDSVADIFEPFRQLDGSSTRRHKGVGLGLAIVKQLVELMEGSIIVESELGKGTTFTVTLPIVNARMEDDA